MLVEQIIKQTVDLQGFRVDTVTKDPGGLIATIRPDTRHRIRCGTCGSPAVYRDMREVRFFRHLPLWNIPVWLCYQPRRVHCSKCNGIRTEKHPWVTGKQRLTRALVAFWQNGPRCCLGTRSPNCSVVPGERLPLQSRAWSGMEWNTVTSAALPISALTRFRERRVKCTSPMCTIFVQKP